jgi:thiol:disulfide interchange protein
MKNPFSNINMTVSTNPIITKSYKFVKEHTLMITVLSVSILILLFILYKLKVFKFKNTGTFREGVENMNDPKGTPPKLATVMMFSAGWCPHCKIAKPEWDAFDSKNTELVNGYKVNTLHVDCTDDENQLSRKLMDKFNVSGFPSVLLLKDNTETTLEGIANSQSKFNIFNLDTKPTTNNLIAFTKETTGTNK